MYRSDLHLQEVRKPLVNEQTLRIVSDLFREKGANAWFELDAAQILPADVQCECGCHEFDKETDTMDVWFDSGSSWAAVIEQREKQPIPVDVYLEGNDQYRWLVPVFHADCDCNDWQGTV